MIRLAQNGAVWTVTIDRPDKANSLTKSMLSELADIAERAGREEVAALILTGTGKVFSAGADLDEARAGLATDGVWERLSGAIARLDALTVAALNGTLAGGAFGMALACDMRIAVPGAKFFYPVMKLGFLPQPFDPVRMRVLIGPARTKLVLLGAQKLTTEEALQFGLIDRIVPGEVLAEHVQNLCSTCADGKPDIRRGIKALIEG